MKKVLSLVFLSFSSMSHVDSFADTSINHSCLTRFNEINNDVLQMSPYEDVERHICISGNLDIIKAEDLTQLPTKAVDFKMVFTSGEFKELNLYCYHVIWSSDDNYQRDKINRRQIHIDNPTFEGEKISSAQCRIYPIRRPKY